jgi:chromosomal replication initiator protein
MTEKSAIEIWSACLEIIKDNLSQQSFKTWFEPIKPVDLKGNVLTIQVPSQFFYEWLEEHYVSLLRKTIKRELGNDGRLEYRIVVDNNASPKKQSTVNYPNYNTGFNENPELSVPLFLQGNTIKNPFIIPGLKKINIESQLNAAYNFRFFCRR